MLRIEGTEVPRDYGEGERELAFSGHGGSTEEDEQVLHVGDGAGYAV